MASEILLYLLNPTPPSAAAPVRTPPVLAALVWCGGKPSISPPCGG